MDKGRKIHIKLKKILKRFKSLGIIESFKLEINFCPIKRNLMKYVDEIDSVLKKCLRKVIVKPRRAEIRNVINELVKKKNSGHDVINQEQKTNRNVCFIGNTNKSITNLSLKFPCGVCDKICDSKKSFAIHNKLHIQSEAHLCDRCGEIIQGRKKLLEHLILCNKDIRLYSSSKNNLESGEIGKQNEEKLKLLAGDLKNKFMACQSPNVEESFETSVPINNAENHTSEKMEEKKFICSCGKVFRLWKSFKKHEKLKHLLRSTKYICQSCGKCFMEKGKLNRHMLSHKGSQYPCSLCSKVFIRSDTLKRHLSVCHSTSKEFGCSFCQKKFKMKYNRDIHEENLHKNFNKWIHCEYCSQKFRNKTSLKSHLKTHLKNEGLVTCTLCSRSFTRKNYYENHFKSKHMYNQKQLDLKST